MKRWGILILVCLLLGVVTTVAVAWGIAVTVSPSATRSHRHFREFLNRSAEGNAPLPYAGIILEESRGPGTAHWSVRPLPRGFPRYKFLWDHELPLDVAPSVPRLQIMLQHSPPPIRSDFRMLIQGRGWPMLALWCQITRDPKTGIDGSALPNGGFNLSGEFWNDVSYGSVMPLAKVVPIFPLLPGFVVDSALFASMWFASVCAFACVRRLRRRALDRCFACGYDLTGNQSGTCPECGATTSARAGPS